MNARKLTPGIAGRLRGREIVEIQLERFVHEPGAGRGSAPIWHVDRIVLSGPGTLTFTTEEGEGDGYWIAGTYFPGAAPILHGRAAALASLERAIDLARDAAMEAGALGSASQRSCDILQLAAAQLEALALQIRGAA